MIRINLLPFRAARKKENIRRQVSIFLLSMVFMLIVLFYYNFSLGRQISKLDTRIKDTKTELAKYNKINKEIAQIKKKLSNLKKKLAVMEKLEADRFAPTQLLDLMTQVVVPKRMWFTRMDAKGNNVHINGIAMDNKTVADFMIRLENSGLFKDVDLKTLKRQQVKKSNFKSFKISCVKVPLQNRQKNKQPVKTKAKK